MPKKKKRVVQRKKKDDSPGDVSECESLERLPSSKKVAAASSTSQLEDEVDQISSFTSISLNSRKSHGGETAALSSSHFFCNYCEFSAESKSVLLSHMRQHMIKCPHCSFSSLSRIEVSRHCKHEHEEDPEGVSQEVDSSSADCEMDKDPCTACVFCSFMTYSTEHLENHTLHKHPGMLAKSVARMITKQNSTEVRRDDALFYLSISNEGLGKSSGYNLVPPEKSSSPIVIDPIVSKPEDVKPEIKPASYIKSSSYSSEQQGKLGEQMNKDNRVESKFGEKMTNRNTLAKAGSSSGITMLVKVETLYCLTCPYSNVYIEKLKCHTVVQHPVGAAAATYNSTGVEAGDITFFCVREDCDHSTSDCTSYQKHLMSCCSCQKTIKVLEKERLKSTITYILEHQKKFQLSPVDGFYDFASTLLDVCLHPTLTGISSSAPIETLSIEQRRTDRSLNMTQNSPMNTAKAPVESSSLATGFYKTPSHLSSTAVSSSGSPNTESNSSNPSQRFFPQQVQGMTQNIHSAASSTGDFQNPMSHNPGMLPVQTDYSPRSLTTEGRSLQPVQSHNTAFYPQSQSNYPQHSSSNSHMSGYPDTQQAVSWQTNQVQATSLSSVPVQSEQNYSNTFLTQNLDVNTTGLLAQNNTAFNPSSQNRSDSFSLGQNHGMNQGFMPATSHSYAPSPGQVSQAPGNGPNLHINNTNSSFPGKPSETSANNFPNVVTASDVMTVSNSMTSNVFYGQQNPVSGVLNTTNIDQHSLDTQPLPKMVDLLSDTYSILLSDEFGPGGQIQQVNNNSFIQTPQTPGCLPPFQPEVALNPQSQTAVSQSTLPVMPKGQPVSYQPMQHEGPRFQQLAIDGSQLPGCENPFPLPVTNQNNQMTSMASSMGQNSGFQTTSRNCGDLQSALSSQNSNNCEQNALSSEESSSAQPGPFQSSEVPNFLISPGTPSSEMALTQSQPAHSFNNRHPSTGQPAMRHPGMFTPPKNSHAGNKFASASPLSPSIYLSGQVPRHRRSNWTDADMNPRGMMSSGVPPRHVHPPVPPPGSQNYMNQRMSVPGRRGYPRGPRMSSGRGRMPTPRMPNNQAGGCGDDDDVILTAVIRGTPPKNQPHQQPGGRGVYRGAPNPVPRGRGQALPVQNRQRNPNYAPRVPYPVAVAPPQTHKHFDISKHFEDLACVVNASADEADGGGDDIQIVAVTPGKDKDKMNQPKAVDASKFSFCCVHCGKDQGSKTVMKQHMKARHNDSLLGAFTNTETGQLLFFCPQLNCEFMTYDEKRLSEHLPKCFDLDRSKPFDFGTAIKNLKSLKIRQLDVRTMGRSQDFPIDLDGQGMKDNFSSSLNDAFGDIVVNASGRHMLRNAAPHQSRLSQPQFQSAQPQSAAVPSKPPVRHLPPSNIATRLPHPRFAHQGNMGNRMHGPVAPLRYTKPPSYGMRPQPRQTGPMDAGNIREMRPRAPSSAANRQPMPLRAPLQTITTPRMPSRGQQEPVIVIDVDSPERPEEGQQYEPMITDSPENSNQLPLVSSGQSSSSGQLETQNSLGYPEMMNANSYPEQSMSDNTDFVPDHLASDLNPESRLSHDDSRLSNRIHASQLSSETDQPGYSYHGSNPVDEAPGSDDDHLQQNSVALSGVMSTDSDSAALSSSREDEPSSDCSPERAIHNSNVSVAERVMGTSTLSSMEYAPIASYAHETSESQSTEHAINTSHDIPTYPSSSSSVTPIPPTNSYLSMGPIDECLDEEEKVNALVLEKVFAKVPNMPKNLSRRLVAKFKEYAKHRGVKITTDSKVIDEFVSKIYYKGSAGDKAASRPQPPPDAPPDAPQFQPAGFPLEPTSTPLPPAVNTSIPSSQNDERRHRDGDDEPPHSGGDYEPPHRDVDDEAPDRDGDYEAPDRDGDDEAPDRDGDDGAPDRDGDYEAPDRDGDYEAPDRDGDCQPPDRDGDYEPPDRDDESPNEYHDCSTDTVQKDVHLKEHVQEEPMTAVDASFSEQFSANDVVATHVILAEKTLHFSPTFASIAMKSSVAMTKILENKRNMDLGQKNVEVNHQTPADLGDSLMKSHFDTESMRVLTRRYSFNDGLLPSKAGLRRSGSLPQIVSSAPASPEATELSHEHIHEDLTTVASSAPVVTADVIESPEDPPTLSSLKDCKAEASEPADETVDRQNLPVMSTEQLKEEVEISFPPAPESETMPILITSSVADIVSGHPGLEVDIAGKPLKQELMDEDNKDMDDAGDYEDNQIDKSQHDLVVSPKADLFEKVTPKSSDLIDRKTGKLLLKKNKRGRPRKLFVEKEEKHQEEKKNLEAEEEHIVKRSSKSRKLVKKDYMNDTNEKNELSDDNDEYRIDKDYYDTDPGLEIDIAGKPLKQEFLDENNKDMDDVGEEEDNHVGKSKHDLVVSPKDLFEKVTPKSSNFIDRKTGKLLLKKTKRGRPRKLFVEKGEKHQEEKNLEAEEEHIVKRSSKSCRLVKKDYMNDTNEKDELMSDDNDEYHIDKDYYDTDPGLEIDIAGKPLKQELLDENNKDMDDVGEEEDNHVGKSKHDSVVSPKEDLFEKVTPKSSNFIDRKTGKLLLKKTKRGRPRKLFVEKEEKQQKEKQQEEKQQEEKQQEEKQQEEKQQEEKKNLEAEEEHIVRRSSRSRKLVNKDYRNDANEIDELMSDDDDEYHIDEDDYDTDTDGDWRGGDSDQPPKKRIKKVVPPPDPSAFDISTKGKFKCWLCKKVFSRCTFAKSHIIQKHKEGLCAVYMDSSEESKALSLLVFCPRKCRYVTLNLEGLMNHVENCAETELEADGKPYLEINKGFLNNRYKELQAMSLEAVLSIPRTRKPKDPNKSPKKVKKSVNMNKSTTVAPVIINHSESSVTIEADNVITSTVASILPSSSPMAVSPVALQASTSHLSNIAAHGPTHPQPPIRSPPAVDQCTLISSNKNCFLPQKQSHHNSPKLSGQHAISMAVDMTSPHFHHTISSPVSSASPGAYKHLPVQHIFGTSEQIQAGSFIPQPATPRMSNIGFSASEQVKSGSSFPQPAMPRMSNIGFSASEQMKSGSSFPQPATPRMSNIGFSASEQVKSGSSFPQPATPRMSNIGFSASEQVKSGSSFPQPGTPRMSNIGFTSSEQVKAGSSFSQANVPRITNFNTLEQSKAGSLLPQSSLPRMSNIGFNTSEQVKAGSSFPQSPLPRMSNVDFSTSEQVKAGSSFPQSPLPRMSNVDFSTSEQVKAGSSFPQSPLPRMSNVDFSTSEQVKAGSSCPQPAQSRMSNSSYSSDLEDDIVYMIEDNGTICLK